MTLEELKELRNPEVLEVIKKNEKESPDSFVLKNSKNKNLPVRAIAEQILCRKKARKKLPELSLISFLYNSISLEQCSGEIAARFKTTLISGQRLLDMTGGLGIDDIYLSEMFESIEYCEMNETLAQLMIFNTAQLKIGNININRGDSKTILNKFPDNHFDWIYLDPSRRDENQRSVDLEFCSPNVYEIYELLFAKSKNLCIKVSPAFDISEAVKRFPELKKIVVVSVDGECKEVLLLIEKNYDRDINLQAAVLDSQNNDFFIEKNVKQTIDKNIADIPLLYIFEPDPAIIKAGLTSKLAAEKDILFINSTIDYLTGKSPINDFPGRYFRIEKFAPFKPAELKNYLKTKSIKKANFAKRDFPLSVDELRKKTKTKEGGNDYFFFTRNKNKDLIYIHAIR